MTEHADVVAGPDSPGAIGWTELLARRLILPLGVLLGGVLLHSMNVLITLMPSSITDLGGANLMSWPTTPLSRPRSSPRRVLVLTGETLIGRVRTASLIALGLRLAKPPPRYR